MSDLLELIQRRQDTATDLEGLLSALEHLHNESTGLIGPPPCAPAGGG